MDVTVTPSRSGSAFQNAADEKGLAVDRSIFIGCDHHDGVADFGAKPLSQELRHQHFSLVQCTDAFFPCGNSREHLRQGSKLFFRIYSVDPDISGLGKIAEQGAELYPLRIGFDLFNIPKSFFHLRHRGRRYIQIQRKTFNRSHVTAAMDLQSSEIRVGDLGDHEILDRGGHATKTKTKMTPNAINETVKR